MSEQKESKVNVKVALSWGLPWFAGMLFTLGFAPSAQALDLGAQIGRWLLYFVAWPFILGQKLGAPPV